MAVTFEITARDCASAARAGCLRTPHGIVHTPAFMPVGTRAAVKTLTPHMLLELGAEIILANTYHLHVRPGAELVAALGGLHGFMSWPRTRIRFCESLQSLTTPPPAEASGCALSLPRHR